MIFNVVVAVVEPLVPLIVIDALPGVALLLAVRVSVDEVFEEVGLKTAVTPLGRPLAVNVTLLLNPLRSVTLMADVPAEP